MLKTRQEMMKILNCEYKYLCPSNFSHINGGLKKAGYKLISITGKGKQAKYEIEEIPIELESDEIWANYPLAEGYQVSNYGKVKYPKGGLMKGTYWSGYHTVQVTNENGNYCPVPVHRMVMLSFCPIENPEMFVVDHINGIRTDNRLCNLRWVFQSDNNKFSDQNNTSIKEIIPLLIQKYGYEETKQKLLELL